MIIPIRCFSCGKVVGEYYEEFEKRTSKGETAEKVLDDLGITRYCCRRMILSNVDLMDNIIKYTR
ncbi:DNA-directed RNA polymerase subunit N [Candidatus Micrarchaeota archaeon]|nr:DNA-directed RNA polymerase subunit N [Candidatus Micrarchaeota archaeon]MBU2476409.1 DNA-directed RNA polymerase subunit N [Candidatus Micrarchaeota archaeon]